MKICIIGTGYVGLPLAAAFANVGNEVTCLDLDVKKIHKLNSGVIPIFEPGLEDLIHRNNKQMIFTTDIELAISNNDILFICVGTPQCTDGSADLKYVLSVAKSIGKYMTVSKIIVNKSTVPIGTADLVHKTIQEELNKRNLILSFQVVSNPEFMREGCAVEDVLKPDRVVIGTDDKKTGLFLKRLYEPFVLNGNPIVITDIRSAEMIKYASNCFLAMKISFMNEIANICEKVNANVLEVRKGMATDHRIGDKFLYSGIGFGGSCLVAGTKILTYVGVVNIEDLKIDDEVFDDNGLTTITSINSREVEETIKFTVRGRELHGSLDHIHFVVEKDKLKEILLKDIKQSDWIYVPQSIRNIGMNDHSFFSPTMKPFKNGWKLKVTSVKKMGPETVYSIETESHKYIANTMLTHNCFGKDLNALYKISCNVDEESFILDSVIRVNDNRPIRFVSTMEKHVSPTIVTVWGTAFKPETDDIRDSAAIKVIKLLLEKGIHVNVYDPMSLENTKFVFGDQINYFENQYDCLNNADCLLLCTEWSQFRMPNWDLMKELMKQYYIFDGRNQYDPHIVQQQGFKYISIGRPYAGS